MLHFTLIARQNDALALSADTENSVGVDLERNKVTAKNILRKLAGDSSRNVLPQLLSIESQNYAYHVLTEGGVLFLTMCDNSSSSALAFAYLEDVAREFLQQYGNSIVSATRPYSFIKFDLYLQKTKKVFSSTTSARSAVALQRPGRPLPVKKTFREVMGHVDGPSGAAPPGSPVSKTQTSSNDLMIIYGVVGVIAFLVVGALLYVVLS